MVIDGTILPEENIQLGRSFATKEEAISAAGQILVDHGYCLPAYIESMQERERTISVHIGNDVAIPHGVDGSAPLILKTGLSVITVPEGVSFGEDRIARLIVGIAAVNDEHLPLLTNLAIICCDMDNVEKLVAATDPQQIIDILTTDVM